VPRPDRVVFGLALAATLAAVGVLTSGCGTGGLIGKGDAARGKQLFVQKCGGCHTLADAGTTGTIGPNLDDAFSGSRYEGFAESTIRNVVHGQILFAVSNPAGLDRQGRPVQGMPENLVTGKDAEAVATYVASVAGTNANVGASTQATTAPPPPTTTAATTTTGTTTMPTTTGGGANVAAQGKAVFTAQGCASCHTLKAAGAAGTVGPDLDQLAAQAQKAGKPLGAFIKESIVNPNAYVEPGFPKGVMPTTFSSLPKGDLDALVTFLASAAGG
jgi:cytochrome c551/c552